MNHSQQILRLQEGIHLDIVPPGPPPPAHEVLQRVLDGEDPVDVDPEVVVDGAAHGDHHHARHQVAQQLPVLPSEDQQIKYSILTNVHTHLQTRSVLKGMKIPQSRSVMAREMMKRLNL